MATRLLLVSVVLLGTAGTVLPARRDCSRAACKDEVVLHGDESRMPARHLQAEHCRVLRSSRA
jgi:hypothetical protein